MDIERIADAIFAQVAAYVSKTLEPLNEKLAELEARKPEKGERGEAGETGPAGRDGERGPAGQDGVGEKGADGADGRNGLDGKDGIDGRDGRDGLPGLQGEKGERGSDGKDGRDGIDGKDGLGFDDLSMEYDGVRGFTLKFVRGSEEKLFAFSLPVPVYRGVFKEGDEYAKHDTATWGGSVWMAKADTTNKPGQSDDWQLMVKQGGEGKSAYDIAKERGYKGSRQDWVNDLFPVGETIVKVRQ
jgi:hypothetical protein